MEPFRLISYNVKCFPWAVPYIKGIVDWLVQHADVVALQEVWCQHTAWSTLFAAHGWTFMRPAREHHILSVFGSGLAVAWRSTDWHLADARFYPFLNSSGIDRLVAKGWFHVELLQKHTGKHLRILNTHMQADYDIAGPQLRDTTEQIRMEQARQLVEIEKPQPPMSTLIVGDMNTDECWFPHCKRWRIKGITHPETNEAIDHCTTWRGTKCWIREHTIWPLEWSDHHAVSWTLVFDQ